MPEQPPTPSPNQDLAAAVRELVASSPHLREAARHLGSWLLEISRAGDTAPAVPDAARTATGAAPAPVHAVPRPEAEAAPPAPVIVPRPIRGPQEVIVDPETAAAALQRGLGSGGVSPRVQEPVPVMPPAAETVPALDVALVATRCRLKSVACGFARRRDEHLGAGGTLEDLKAEYDGLIEQARHPQGPIDCYLWMANHRWTVGDAERWVQLEQAYANLAEAACLVHDQERSRAGSWIETLWLLAEAQSALFVALQASPWGDADPDQQAAYAFVRDEARRLGVRMHRYLSRDATADPAEHANLATRIASARARVQAEHRQAKAVDNALSKVRYEARRLAQGAVEDRPEHARTLERHAQEFLRVGGEARDPALREAVASGRSLWSQVLPPDSVLHALAAAEAPEEDGDGTPDERLASPELEKARDLLHDRTVLLLGGEERPLHARRTEERLGLRELRWVSYRAHTSLAPLEPEIARPEVDVVLLPIRWNGTETGPVVREWCRRHGKPCVILKAGYNANQIAHAVLEQVSERLAAGR